MKFFCRTVMRRMYLAVALACSILSASGTAADIPETTPWERNFFLAEGAEVIAAANVLPLPEDAAITVLLDEATISFDAEGRRTSRYRLAYRILSMAGIEEWGTVSASWDPWYEDRPVLRARVINPDGKEHILAPENIAEAPLARNANAFDDRRVLRGPLPALMVGAVVEQEILCHEREPFFSAGDVGRYYFGQYVPTRKTRLILDYPTNLPLRYVTRLLPELVPTRSDANGRTRLTFESAFIAPLEAAEPGMPGDIPRWPHVAYSTGRSWNDVARTYGEIVERQIGSADLAPLVREIIGGATEPKEIATRLLAYLRNGIRYVQINFGEASIVPHSPQETLRHRYGDCKDQAALLIRMLRTAGVPAYMALIRSGADADVEPELPGLGDFNHAIVHIPGKEPLWIDPTEKVLPVGELPLYTQGRRALIADGETTTLIMTPQSPAAENRQVETREFFLAEAGKARVTETTEAWGWIAASYRDSYSGINAKTIGQQLEGYVRDAYGAERLDKVETTDPADLDKSFRIFLETPQAQVGMTDEKEAVAAIFHHVLAERLPDEFSTDQETPATPRKQDYLLRVPYIYELRYRIIAPPGFRARPLPDSGTTALGPMQLFKEFRLEQDGAVTAVLRFDTGRQRFTPAEFEAARKAVQILRNEEPFFIRFEHIGQSLLAAGKIREALGEFRRLSVLHPDEALHRIQLANALLDAGLRNAALAEAKKAVALEPSSPVAQRTLAWVLQHDETGRLRGKGFDRDRALAAYRKAKELDPNDFETRGDLAILLEHNREGERYTSKADMGLAIEEYRFLRDVLKETRLDENLFQCLYRTERWEELRKLLESPDSAANRLPYLLLAVAGDQGAAAAIQEARARIADPERRRSVLEAVASSLTLTRRYPDVALLLDEAAKGAENAMALRTRSNLFRQLEPFEKISFAEETPSDIFKRMLLSLLLPESAPDSFLSLFAGYIQKEIEQENSYAQTLRYLDHLAAQIRTSRGERPAEVVADITLGAIEFAAAGNDASGYRMEAEIPALGGREKLRFYLTKEEGHYRLVAGNTFPDMIGMEVLRRLAAGDVDSAKLWLDWARDEMDPATDDDPLSAEPFLVVWPEGSEATPQTMSIAAAILISRMENEKVISILLQGRETTTGAARTAITLALARHYLAGEKYPEFLGICDELAETSPLSLSLFLNRVMALKSLARHAEIKALAEARLRDLPSDSAAVRALAVHAEQSGDFEAAAKRYRILVEEGSARASDYNNLAWLGLFLPSLPAEYVTFAERAVALTQNQNPAFLHTLAALYAESGKIAEARATLLKVLAADNGEVLRTENWYVFGRIAEEYGEIAAAMDFYGKLSRTDPGADSPIATFALTHKRMHRMVKAK